MDKRKEKKEKYDKKVIKKPKKWKKTKKLGVFEEDDYFEEFENLYDGVKKDIMELK